MRVIRALLGGRHRTTAQLQGELSDVPAATLYRHIAQLVDGGVLEVVAERRVRGAVERTYALVEGAASLGEADVAELGADAVGRGFAAFLAGLAAGFDHFLAHTDDLGQEIFGYRSAAFWLTDQEVRGLLADLAAALEPYRDREEASDRRLRHLSTVLFPDAPPPPAT